MKQRETEFFETLKRLRANEKNLLINDLYHWVVCYFHYEKFGIMCPVCGNPNSTWIVTYEHKETTQRCCVCKRCAGLIPRNNANELIGAYVQLKAGLDMNVPKAVLDFCLNAGVIDRKGYDAYLNICSLNPKIILTEKQRRLIRAINYQFVKLARELMPNKDMSTFEGEAMYVTY